MQYSAVQVIKKVQKSTVQSADPKFSIISST